MRIINLVENELGNFIIIKKNKISKKYDIINKIIVCPHWCFGGENEFKKNRCFFYRLNYLRVDL